MPIRPNTRTLSVVPLGVGFLLWSAATALLLEHAVAANQWDVAHAIVPMLTSTTICAAVIAHRRLADLRLLSATGFVALALLGSAILVYGTLGRQAEARDVARAKTTAANRTFGLLKDELDRAKLEAARECRALGPRCVAWQSRVDKLTGELSGISVLATDARADAIAELVTLVSEIDKARVRAIVSALDPIALPLFLELGSVLFFAIAFPVRKSLTLSRLPAETEAALQETVHLIPETVHFRPRALTQQQALRDLLTMKACGSQQFLAARWRVSEGCVSRWLKAWERAGAIRRERDGKWKQVSASDQDGQAIGRLPFKRHTSS